MGNDGVGATGSSGGTVAVVFTASESPTDNGSVLSGPGGRLRIDYDFVKSGFMFGPIVESAYRKVGGVNEPFQSDNASSRDYHRLVDAHSLEVRGGVFYGYAWDAEMFEQPRVAALKTSFTLGADFVWLSGYETLNAQGEVTRLQSMESDGDATFTMRIGIDADVMISRYLGCTIGVGMTMLANAVDPGSIDGVLDVNFGAMIPF